MSILQKNSCPPSILETQPSSSPTVSPRFKTSTAETGEKISRLASVVVAVTFQRLIEDGYAELLLEEELVLQALRRSTHSLETASASEISDYLSSLDEAQIRGVASNVKGIYHELLFVQAENEDWDGISAKVKEFTNHPGGDVEFIVDGNSIGEVQLKAISSERQVLEHLARYPDIDIRVTEEIAAKMPDIESSGFSNIALTQDVNERLQELKGDGLVDEVSEGLIVSSLVNSAIVAGKVVRGQNLSKAQLQSFLVDAGVGVTTAAVLDMLLLPLTN